MPRAEAGAETTREEGVGHVKVTGRGLGCGFKITTNSLSISLPLNLGIPCDLL